MDAVTRCPPADHVHKVQPAAQDRLSLLRLRENVEINILLDVIEYINRFAATVIAPANRIVAQDFQVRDLVDNLLDGFLLTPSNAQSCVGFIQGSLRLHARYGPNGANVLTPP